MARDNGSAAEALDSTDYTDGTDDTGDTGRDGRSRVQWPTVAMSVGLSTLAAAVVIGVGSAVMIAHSDNGDPVVVREAADSVTTHGKSWPTTSASASKKPSSPAKPSAGAKPDTKQDAAAGKSDHGSHGGGDNGGDAGDTAVPPQPSAAELQNQLESMLAPGASDDQIAANLASPAGAGSIKAAGAQMRAFPIFHFQVDEPITVDGDEMTATINMSMTGLGTKPPQNLYYQVRDGRWVLTDESVCLIAQQARVDCSV